MKTVIVLLMTLLTAMPTWAWDTTPNQNGKYDKYYERPTHFPDFKQPGTWPNAQYYIVCARYKGSDQQIQNYEVAVYDQNNELRACCRSTQKDNHLCVLTIKGKEGDQFHCKVLYGDFVNPVIEDVPETFGFKTNNVVGTSAPFFLSVPARTILSELSTSQPEDQPNKTNIFVERTLHAAEWGTICLPFAMTALQAKTAFGENAIIGDFIGCKTTFETDGETVKGIDVAFSKVNILNTPDDEKVMEANHPYIIKVGRDIESFWANDIIIQISNDPVIRKDAKLANVGGVEKSVYNRFVGCYAKGTVIPENSIFLYENEFWYSAGKTVTKAFRAYFDFYDRLIDKNEAPSRINFSFDETTGLSEELRVKSEEFATATWYDLNGRKLNGEPSAKGLYIYNGKKIFK
jgi:hypothetical protein